MNGELTKQDVDAIAEYRRDPKYLEYYYRPAYTREECVRFVDKCIAWSKENPRCKFQFAITVGLYSQSLLLIFHIGSKVHTKSSQTLRGYNAA